MANWKYLALAMLAWPHLAAAATPPGVQQPEDGSDSPGSTPLFRREVHRARFAPPSQISMGTPLDFTIRFPANQVESVDVWEDGRPNGHGPNQPGHGSGSISVPFVGSIHVPFESTEGGQTLAHVPPLSMGKVKFVVTIVYKDFAFENKHFTLDVEAPKVRPQLFLADANMVGRREHAIMYQRPGDGQTLWPVAFFASAPLTQVDLRGYCTFRLMSTDEPPVISLSADGTLKALREGDALISVEFAGFTTQAAIRVVIPRPMMKIPTKTGGLMAVPLPQ